MEKGLPAGSAILTNHLFFTYSKRRIQHTIKNLLLEENALSGILGAKGPRLWTMHQDHGLVSSEPLNPSILRLMWLLPEQ